MNDKAPQSIRVGSLQRFGIRLLGAWMILGILASPVLLSARSIIEAGNATVWSYVDDGKKPDAKWREADFDDSKWKSGKGPIGYGRTNLGTEVGWGPDKDNRYITTWFRHTFDRPDLKPGERLVINFCVDDGLVIYLNGREIGRENLPDGPLTPTTLAPRAIGPNDEGFYQRMPVPVDALRPGRNVLAVEVHQCSPKSHDIFLDLALETMPADFPTPPVPDAARAVVETFRYTNYVGPDTRIPDGYEDGGHAMRLDADRPPISGREILIVDRARDTGLGKDLAFAHSSELQALPPRERALRLATHIDEETTPPGGVKWAEPTCGLLEKEFKNKPVFLSDWIEQAHAGVCRHRALLFKVLAQEAGLKVALVRGHFVDRHLPDGGQHCWNELFLDDYQRVLVDVMMKGRKQDFPEVTSPAVVEHYRKQDNSPWYNPKVQ